MRVRSRRRDVSASIEASSVCRLSRLELPPDKAVGVRVAAGATAGCWIALAPNQDAETAPAQTRTKVHMSL